MNFKKMMTKKNLWIGGGLLAAILFYLYFRHKADSRILEYTGVSEKWNNAAQNPANLDGNKILKKGSRGPEVSALQIMLKGEGQDLGNYGPLKDGVDGVFGDKTETALFNARGVKEITLNQASAMVSQEVISQIRETDIIYN